MHTRRRQFDPVSALPIKRAATGSGAQNLKQSGRSTRRTTREEIGFEVADANVAVARLPRDKLAAKEVAEKICRRPCGSQRAESRLHGIRSPVKGVIIDRRVNVGQTVVSSLNAPSLFLIAKNLKRLEIWTSVNEADIGRIAVGQPATFAVDAFPSEVFQGVVKQKRLNATMTQNVVTYTVVVGFDNADEKLLPYLTANVRFHIARRSDALMVPNAALRWQPLASQVADDYSIPREKKNDASRGVIWVDVGGFVRPVEVKIGVTDGTELLATCGTDSLVGERSDADSTSNPFAWLSRQEN